MEMLLQDSRALGATAFRWNAFLKGLDFEWETEPIPQDQAKRFDQRHIVKGLKPGCMEVIREVADLAAEYGLLLQVVLSTAHFFRFGYGGADFELQGISNRQRVSNLHHMLTDEAAMRAYFVRAAAQFRALSIPSAAKAVSCSLSTIAISGGATTRTMGFTFSLASM
ncbi:hypothetical protein AB1Y20_021449 [Prymnesium parvum]|uniref:Uncharacterized protein n=1 Tax=Prymnesium parvum TaxID=97485 RepID=A0AB34JIP5_PRYPA